MTTLQEETLPKSLLVVGDMVVDDTWVVGEYRSPTATHTGRIHYRSLHHPGSATKQHCGVGRVASILSHARLSLFQQRFAKDVHVIGVWAPGDTEGYLRQMFMPENLMGSNSYRMVPPDEIRNLRACQRSPA